MAATVNLRPQTLDLKLYGSDPWSVQLTITGLGSLVGAEVVARARPSRSAESVDLTVTTINLVDGVFSIGHDGPIGGTWDLQITLPGSTPRTYLKGSIDVTADKA